MHDELLEDDIESGLNTGLHPKYTESAVIRKDVSVAQLSKTLREDAVLCKIYKSRRARSLTVISIHVTIVQAPILKT
jgi:hypothetical protein